MRTPELEAVLDQALKEIAIHARETMGAGHQVSSLKYIIAIAENAIDKI